MRMRSTAINKTSSTGNFKSPGGEMENEECHPQENEILKGVSVYFNPGELVGIMGPSGECTYHSKKGIIILNGCLLF